MSVRLADCRPRDAYEAGHEAGGRFEYRPGIGTGD